MYWYILCKYWLIVSCWLSYWSGVLCMLAGHLTPSSHLQQSSHFFIINDLGSFSDVDIKYLRSMYSIRTTDSSASIKESHLILCTSLYFKIGSLYVDSSWSDSTTFLVLINSLTAFTFGATYMVQRVIGCDEWWLWWVLIICGLCHTACPQRRCFLPVITEAPSVPGDKTLFK